MGRLYHRDALSLLPHQLNLPRTWGGKARALPLFTLSLVLMQHLSSAVKAKCQQGKQ